jgi:glyoxylase-like metal-dependent hydrolase (beta-lactamase superfamily II)
MTENLSRKEARNRYILDRGIHAIRVPMPLIVDHANAYLINGSEPVLIDTGFNHPDSLDTLTRGLQEVDLHLKDIRLVLLTHGHRDHAGLAEAVKNASGARVLMHEGDSYVLAPDAFISYLDRVLQFYRQMGAPEEKIEMTISLSKAERAENEKEARRRGAFTVDGFLSAGDEFPSGAGKISVVETPGHSRGSVSFLISDAGTLFSGDILSAQYDPLPLVMVDRDGDGWFNPYDLHLDSLRTLKTVRPKLLLPGHGGPIVAWEKIVDRIFRTQEKLTHRVTDIVKSGETLTIAEIADRIYPDVIGPLFTLSLNMVRGIVARMAAEGRIQYNDGEGMVRWIRS